MNPAMTLKSVIAKLPKRTFFRDLYREINDDNVFNGAAALSYYLLFAIFPAMIFLLSVIPYLPIENLHQEVMGFFAQFLPGEASKQIEGVVSEITKDKKPSLLSFGALLTLWSASAGLYAIMQALNITYDVKESRPFWKARGVSVMLTALFGVLLIGSLALIVFGGQLQTWLDQQLGWGTALLVIFSIFRYAVVLGLLLTAFGAIYYFGPDVEQDFRFISPGALTGTIVLVAASLLFRFYVDQFGDYAATYGSLGAVIVLMLWLYIAGVVILLGSEINALVEHYSPEGKEKGEKAPGDTSTARASALELPKNALGHKKWMWERRTPSEQPT